MYFLAIGSVRKLQERKRATASSSGDARYLMERERGCSIHGQRRGRPRHDLEL
ncbi:hypothetical protein GQ55_4G207000 [Panicum hallii var. hallii]|uniref:Uncharacterized protein n=1 Tax=Panicum hallii var. hallii TaxID=1504633 RepID=A0A2T7DZ85_9POAL|nr:hypothetical protein GQ55_4G207000 [Panicum hallii var. hallii]